MPLVCGLLGFPIAHSRSPDIHNSFFRKFGVDATYSLFEIHNSTDAEKFLVNFMSHPLSLGLNITIPHKTMVTKLGIHCDVSARDVGAANTLYRMDKGIWMLGNTDVYGFEQAVQELKFPETSSAEVIILGAGGSAKAAIIGAKNLGFAKTTVLCRNPIKATQDLEHLASSLPICIETFANAIAKHDLIQKSSSAVLVVNTLPIGHSGEKNSHASAVFAAVCRARNLNSDLKCYFLDLVYSETPAFFEARDFGFAVSDGKFMLAEQARMSFTLWMASGL